MPVFSNFNTIVGDTNIRIGDNSHENGFTSSFNTGNRHAEDTALISFMVKGMTVTNDSADVFVNDQKVGVLFKNKGGDPEHWQTQTVSLGGSTLNNGQNVLRVGAVTNPAVGGGDFDDFFIRNVICHFHKST